MKSEKITPEKYLEAGNQLIKAGQIEEAISQYQLALSLNPNYFNAHHQLGEIYKNKKEYATSILHYQQAEKIQPENFTIKGLIANCLMQQGNLNLAIKQYETALTLKGKKPAWLYQQLGDVYIKNEQLEQAKIIYKQAIEINPKKPFVKTYEVLLAVTQDRKAIENDPTKFQIYEEFGDVLTRVGKLEAAVSYYQQAIELEPKRSADIYKKLGNKYAQIGKLDEAIVYHQKGINAQKNWYSVREKKYEFTTDWFTSRIPVWKKHLQQFASISGVKALEIGSWEGMSTCWLLDNILIHDKAKITCIDTFSGGIEHKSNFSITSLEQRFDRNVMMTGNGHKVKKMVGKSQDLLPKLIGEYYDLIYVDGSHKAPDVLLDALMCWQMLKVGGIIIFDDYQWKAYPEPILNPQPGIDAFLELFNDYFKVLDKGSQIIIKKVKEMPN